MKIQKCVEKDVKIFKVIQFLNEKFVLDDYLNFCEDLSFSYIAGQWMIKRENYCALICDGDYIIKESNGDCYAIPKKRFEEEYNIIKKK